MREHWREGDIYITYNTATEVGSRQPSCSSEHIRFKTVNEGGNEGGGIVECRLTVDILLGGGETKKKRSSKERYSSPGKIKVRKVKDTIYSM